MKALSLIPIQLPSVSYSASGNATTDLRRLPHRLFGRIAHLAGITFDIECTPTFTTAPTALAYNNGMCSRLEIFDGTQVRLSCDGFSALRFFERSEHGRDIVPEIRLSADVSGDTFGWSRHWSVGPPLMAGSPSDFLIPCSALENGEIRYSFGALTAFSADTTAVTATIRPIALIALLDEIRIPPFIERVQSNWTAADNQISGKFLLANLALADSTSWGAWAAGELSSVTVETGSGQLVPGVDAEALGRTYNYLRQTGDIGALMGEFRAADDLGPHMIDTESATALANSTRDCQMVFAAPPDCQISKLPFVESQMRVRWSGSQASGVCFATRILEQTNEMVASMAARVSEKLGVKVKGIKIKTLSKQPYDGPYKSFMPWKASV